MTKKKPVVIPELEKLAEKQKDGRMKKVLLFDIETAPIKAYVWRIWKENVAPCQIIEDWSVLSWAAKWLGEPDVMTDATWFHSPHPRDDKEICRSLHALMDEADVLVAHNGKKFDVKKINTRFAIHKFGPPKPYKIVDTLLIARGNFAFTSNRLDELGKVLGIGRKVEHEGFELWAKVLDKDAEAQDLMVEYNVGDVVLLEQVYAALRPWDKRHPNVNLEFDALRCSVCSCENLRQRGEVFTPVNAYGSYQCVKCGHWMRGTVSTRDKEERARVGRNVV